MPLGTPTCPWRRRPTSGDTVLPLSPCVPCPHTEQGTELVGPAAPQAIVSPLRILSFLWGHSLTPGDANPPLGTLSHSGGHRASPGDAVIPLGTPTSPQGHQPSPTDIVPLLGTSAQLWGHSPTSGDTVPSLGTLSCPWGHCFPPGDTTVSLGTPSIPVPRSPYRRRDRRSWRCQGCRAPSAWARLSARLAAPKSPRLSSTW